MCHYGVSFSKEDNKFTMFVDNDNNQIFSAEDGILEEVSFKSPIDISSLTCQGLESGINGLNIVFMRPYTDAWIRNDPTSFIEGHVSCDLGKIRITDGQNVSTIVISRAGQISIQ